jgi:hypothetical protein
MKRTQRELAGSGCLAGSGFATGGDAAYDAVEQAVEEVGGTASLVLVFPPGRLAPELALAQAESAALSAPVAGMTSDGVIGLDGLLPDGCAAIAFDLSVAASVGRAAQVSVDPEAAGRAAAAEALTGLDVTSGHPLVLVFLDPDSADYADVIAGVYEITGARVPIAGGGANAPFGNRSVSPALLGGGRVCRDCVVVVALVSPRPIAIGITHGCHLRGVPAIVTRSDGRSIKALNGRPAEHVFLEAIGAADEGVDTAAFERLAALHPLAQFELGGGFRLRHVRGRSPGGGLRCATTVPENAAIGFTEQTTASISASSRAAVRQALAELNAPARAALVFDCAARRRIPPDEDALATQIDALTSSFATPHPVVGMYTRGEVGRLRGAVGDLNHVVVVAAFA